MKAIPVSTLQDVGAKKENKLLRHIACSALLAFSLTACASPLWSENDGSKSPGTVPRDENGEPVWDQVKPNPSERR